MDYTVFGTLQARILEWVSFSFSRGFSQPRDQTQVSHIAGRFFTSWATGEALELVGVWFYTLLMRQFVLSLRLLENSLAWYIVFIPKVCPVCVLKVGSRYLLSLLVEIQALISVFPAVNSNWNPFSALLVFKLFPSAGSLEFRNQQFDTDFLGSHLCGFFISEIPPQSLASKSSKFHLLTLCLRSKHPVPYGWGKTLRGNSINTDLT